MVDPIKFGFASIYNCLLKLMACLFNRISFVKIELNE